MKKINNSEEAKKYDGKKVKFTLANETEGEGKIHVEYGNVFICQNVVDGVSCEYKLGYSYSWWWIQNNVIECYLMDEEYEYLQTDFVYPSWWDGRPILGYFWNDEFDEKIEGFLVGIRPDVAYPFIRNNGMAYENFEPILKNKKTFHLSITDEKGKREVELTEEQVKVLGI